MAVTWAKIMLEADVILKALLTEQGDVIYASGVATPAALPHGDAGNVLTSGGHGANPAWAAPGAPAAHDILSASHGDALAGAVVDGDVVIGNVTPKWSRLAISIPAASVRNVLGIDNAELRPSWKVALDATNPANIAAAASPGTSLVFAHRDHVHAHPDLGDLHTVYLLASGARALAGNQSFAGYQATDFVVENSATPPATPVVGKIYFDTTAGDLHPYICTVSV